MGKDKRKKWKMSNAEVTQYQEKFKGRKTGFSPKKDKYKPNWEWEK